VLVYTIPSSTWRRTITTKYDNDLDQYQEDAIDLAVYPTDVWDSYLPLQLASEAGEVAAEFAKPQRKGTDYNKEKIKLELGDVLWYVANIAGQFNLSLGEIMEANIKKLNDRRKEAASK
jgi:NTP pyrophosphatase (non-canonical NTP hydrolase)